MKQPMIRLLWIALMGAFAWPAYSQEGSLTDALEQRIREGVRRIVGNVAEAMGVEAEIEIPYGANAPVTYNDPNLTAEMAPTLEAIAGSENVAIRKAQTGAEDFAFISERVPSFYYFLGGRPSETPESAAAPHHTPDFLIDEDALMLGVRSMTALALSYLETH